MASSIPLYHIDLAIVFRIPAQAGVARCPKLWDPTSAD
jgi:hypothetical protein